MLPHWHSNSSARVDPGQQAVPEPGTLTLFGRAGAGMTARRVRTDARLQSRSETSGNQLPAAACCWVFTSDKLWRGLAGALESRARAKAGTTGSAHDHERHRQLRRQLVERRNVVAQELIGFPSEAFELLLLRLENLHHAGRRRPLGFDCPHLQR